MTVITTNDHLILDSSGQPAEGRILVTQSARFEVTGGLVTTTQATVTVKRGRIERPNPFNLPATPDGEGVLVTELFTNRGEDTKPVSWWATVPSGGPVEFADLPQITAPTAGPGVPSWAADLLAALEDVGAVDDAIVAGLVPSSSGSATSAALSATIATLRGFDVGVAGAVGNGAVDDTAAIQAAIDAARDAVRATEMGTSGLVFMPSGKYRVTGRIVQPPYVKIITQGSVVILTDVDGDSAWHVAPLADDPTTLYSKLVKAQWMQGPVIDGSLGGFILANDHGSTSATRGLELAARSSLGTSKPMGRYSMRDVAIQGYHEAIRWNPFDHYIAAYTGIKIENCDIICQIGTGAAPSNSGENITWTDCLFGSSTGDHLGFVWDATAINMNFTDCSFDYLGTVFLFNESYQRVMVRGGHMEQINAGARHSSSGGIAVSTTGAVSVIPDVDIEAPLVSAERGVQFRGYMYLRLSMTYRNNNDNTSNQTTDKAFLCDPDVRVIRSSYLLAGGGPSLQRALNEIRDPVFAGEADSTDAGSLTHWTLAASGTSTRVVDPDSPVSGGKSILVQLTGSAYVRLTQTAYSPCTPQDVIWAQMAYKFASASPGLSIGVTWFDSEKASIQVVNPAALTRTATAFNAWRVCNSPLRFVAPPGACFYKMAFQTSSSVGDATDIRISDFHAFKG